MKVGTLTFHGAHNYGSVLQAYALQKVLDDIVGSNEHEIINFRKAEQKQYYNVYNQNNSVKNILSNIYNFWHRKELKTKFNRFETFINKELPLSHEVNSRKAVLDIANDYESIICGSDQIWNMDSFDYDDVYILPFNVKKKISYATSFGGDIGLIQRNKKKIQDNIKNFDYISVRESKAADELGKILNRNIEQVVDPTILLDKSDWDNIINDVKTEKDEYILFYSLGPSKSDIDIVTKIGKELGYKVLITNTANRNDKKMKAVKDLSIGPREFLSLINDAKFVCTSSFHCTIFSVLFNKQFCCINVQNEERLQSLLRKIKLENRSVNGQNYQSVCRDNITSGDFEEAHRILEKEKEKGLNYLKEALDKNEDM